MKASEIINQIKADIKSKTGVEVSFSAVNPAVTGCRILLTYKGHENKNYRLTMKLIAEGFNETYIDKIADIEDKIQTELPVNDEDSEADRMTHLDNLTYYIISTDENAETGKQENTERFERSYKVKIKIR